VVTFFGISSVRIFWMAESVSVVVKSTATEITFASFSIQSNKFSSTLIYNSLSHIISLSIFQWKENPMKWYWVQLKELFHREFVVKQYLFVLQEIDGSSQSILRKYRLYHRPVDEKKEHCFRFNHFKFVVLTSAIFFWPSQSKSLA
jgi:hypothetical protein